jgi:hypothetical protein
VCIYTATREGLQVLSDPNWGWRYSERTGDRHSDRLRVCTCLSVYLCPLVFSRASGKLFECFLLEIYCEICEWFIGMELQNAALKDCGTGAHIIIQMGETCYLVFHLKYGNLGSDVIYPWSSFVWKRCYNLMSVPFLCIYLFIVCKKRHWDSLLQFSSQ